MAKPAPVKLSKTMVLNFGILSPDGKFYHADAWKHEQVAKQVTGADWETCLDRGWLRLSAGAIYFAFSWQEPTQAQIDAIYEYARLNECSIVDIFESSTRDEAAKFLGLN